MDSDATKQEEPRVLGQRRSMMTWWKEISAILISVACIAAVAVLAWQIDGKISSTWHARVQPNTVISALATVAKGAVLLPLAECISQLKWKHFLRQPRPLRELQTFDEASRGPLGSLKLIFKLNVKAWLACIGAVLTVLSLAMGPFFQAILKIRTGVVSHINDANAAMPRASVYSSESNSSTSTTGPGLASAIFRGAFGQDFSVAYSCPTGNCTWSPFDTLGVSVNCQDVTSETRVTCDRAGKPCTYWTPGGRQVSIGTHLSINVTLPDTIAITADGEFAYIDWTSQTSTSLDSMSDAQTQQCTFQWSRIMHADTHVVNGRLFDVATSIEPLRIYATSILGPASDKIQKRSDSDITFASGGVIAFPASMSLSDGDVGKMGFREVAAHNGYLLTYFDVNSISQYLKVMLMEAVDTNNTALSLEPVTASSTVLTALSGQNNGNITSVFQGIATALTNEVRQGSNSTTILGTTTTNVAQFDIDWIWLIYPIAIVVLASLLLIAVIFDARQSGAVWKSSPLALLFHGLDGWHPEELEIDSLHEMEETAEHMSTRLRESGAILRFRWAGTTHET